MNRSILDRTNLWLPASAVLMSVCALPAADRSAASGTPSEDVMRPTRYGLRATPELVRMFTGFLVEDEGWARELKLTDTQKNQLADAISRRVMATAHADGAQWQALVEYLLEAELRNNGKFDGQSGPELARRFLPLIRPIRDFWNALSADSRAFMEPAQIEQYEQGMKRELKQVDEAQAQMQRWAAGDVDDGGRPFESPRPREPQQIDTPEQKAARQRQRHLKSASIRADFELKQFSTESWEAFVHASASFFGFSGPQIAAGKRLCKGYAAQADAIMTPQWQERFRNNQIKRSLLRGAAPDRDQTAPWMHRLDREYRELTEPVEKLHNSLRWEILGMATDEQRRAGQEKVAALTAKQGLTPDEWQPIEAWLRSGRQTHEVK